MQAAAFPGVVLGGSHQRRPGRRAPRRPLGAARRRRRESFPQDYIVAQTNHAHIHGDGNGHDDGDDYVDVTGDSNSVYGGGGDDVLKAYGANNILFGEAGDDILTADGGEVLSLEHPHSPWTPSQSNVISRGPNKLYGGGADFVWHAKTRDQLSACRNAWCHWGASARDTCNDAPCLDTAYAPLDRAGEPLKLLDAGVPRPEDFTRIWPLGPPEGWKRGPRYWGDLDLAFVDQCPNLERLNPWDEESVLGHVDESGRGRREELERWNEGRLALNFKRYV